MSAWLEHWLQAEDGWAVGLAGERERYGSRPKPGWDGDSMPGSYSKISSGLSLPPFFPLLPHTLEPEL